MLEQKTLINEVMRTSLVLMIASLMKTKLTGAFHLSELVGRISQSIECVSSVKPRAVCGQTDFVLEG